MLMTTSQLADPEVLEWRYPVRQEGYKIEVDSGRRSLRQGGDGSNRKISFFEKFTAPSSQIIVWLLHLAPQAENPALAAAITCCVSKAARKTSVSWRAQACIRAMFS